jgi:hydrogenase maturation protease
VASLGELYEFPPHVELLDGGTMGLDLLPFVEGAENLLIVDAAELGEEPGTVRLLEGSDISSFLDMKFSVHQIGLPDMLFAAELMGISPRRLAMVGVQPQDMGTGTELSETLSNAMGDVLHSVIEKLSAWGVVPSRRSHVPGHTL